MLNNKKKESSPKEDVIFEESFKGVQNDIRLTLIVLVAFFLIAIFAKFIFKASVPFILFVLLFVWEILYLSHYHFIKYKKNIDDLYNFHFRNNIIDIALLTVVIHYLGGVEWIGAIFYLCILAWASSAFSKKKVFLLCLIAIFFYIELALLELLGILPHREIFNPSSGAYQDPGYILIQVAALTIAFLFIIENYGTLSENLRKNKGKLIKAQIEIEEAKNVLEIKVQARTKELHELTEKQEEIIKDRTKEIQEKLEDMERFQKLAVGRELKMIELKREIQKLEEKLK